MRNLIIHRTRTLAAFGVPYAIFLNRNRQETLDQLEHNREQARGVLGADSTIMEGLRMADALIPNGQTIAMEIDQEENHFFVALLRDTTDRITEDVIIPAGTEDVGYVIDTEMQGMRLIVSPAKFKD